MIRGGETGERLSEGGEREEGGGCKRSAVMAGGNGALTVLHSGSSISITLWVSV